MSRPYPLGISATPESVAQLKGFFDFIEPPARVLMGLEDDAAFAPSRDQLLASPLPVRAFNVLFPADLKVVGETVNWDRVESYLDSVINRAAEVGAKVLVFGSGGARAVPEGFPRTIAWGQLVRMLSLGANVAEARGIVFAIEGLRRAECNIINSFREALQLARDVDRPGVRVLADIYHFVEENEPLSDIREGADWLVHVHLSGAERRYPGYGSYPLRELFDVLDGAGYRGGISIECRWGADMPAEALYAAGFLDCMLSG